MTSITYTWKITGVKTKDQGDNTNVIVQTYWDKIGTDSFGNVGTFHGATPFDPSVVDPDNFVNYAKLTEETIIGWIKSVVVGEYEKHVDEQIAIQIDHFANPTVQKDLPWATVAANTSANTK
jgi:hypothetical protein